MAYQILYPVHLITAGDMSASITSRALEIILQDNIGIQLHFTGAPVGTFSVEVSLDHKEDSQGNVTVAGNWVALPLSPAPAATGAAGDLFVELNQTPAAYMRLKYTRTSGTGVLEAFVAGKAI